MKEYKSEIAKILHGDVSEALQQIESNSVDLIFADPPYNIGKDFDGLKDEKAEGEFLNWAYEWIMECHRVLKDNGTFYLMNSTQNMPYLDIFCREHFDIVSRIVWAYDSSGVQAKRYFGSLYEPIIMMVKDSKSYTFNYKDIEVEAKTGAKRKLIDYRKNPPQPYNTKKVPGNVWEFPRVRFKMDEYENHPTQKPEALLERVIRASSNEGDLVLDPFSGSFSTGAVAIRFNRKFLGIEINESYVKMGIRRLSIPSHYTSEELRKEKVRKTKNRSKKERNDDSDTQIKMEMTDYNPDNWVVIKMNGDDPHYRVLAGWSGGYLDGDSWRMNSGITRAEDAGDRFNFYGSSGSCYSCGKESYTLRMNNAHIWAKLQEMHGDKVEMMPEDTDWLDMDWIIK